MDLYGTGYLNRVVESLKRPAAFFLDNFFREIEYSDTETIYFDVERDGERRRLSPFVHPLVEGRMVEGMGYETKSFRPAYIKDKRVHDATRPFRRAAGEQIGTGQQLTAAQRHELNLRRDLMDQTDMLTRRLEVMCIEAVRLGQVTINMAMPDGNEKEVVVDFGRDGDQTINLTGGARWGETDVKPLQDIEDWGLQTLQLSGSSVRNIIMDPEAWKVFRESADLEKRLDLRRVMSGQINLATLPDHIQYKGNDGAYDYWVYADWYYDQGEGAEVAMLPEGTVIGAGDMQGVRHFGAIKDEAAGFQARELFTKSWVKDDPSVRYLLTQSAPLTVPYRVNAAFAAKVLNDA